MVCHGQTGHHDGDHRHEFDEDVEGRTGGVFERIADRVTDYGCLVAVRAFTTEMSFFDIFLGVIPSATGIGHKDSEHETGSQTTDEKTQYTGYTEDQTGDDRYDDGKDRR